MRNEQCKYEDKGVYAINVGSFDIEGELGRAFIMEDGNESLLTIRLQHNNISNHDNAMSIGNNTPVIPNVDRTDVSTFRIDQPSQTDECVLNVLSRYKEDLPVEVLSLL